MPEDLPPPVVPSTIAGTTPAAEAEGPEATGRMEPVEPAGEPELDPRELKALSRQERKDAKAALRREQQEARAAARQAKAAAKAGLVATAGADEDVAEDVSEDSSEDILGDVEPIGSEAIEADEVEASDAAETAETAEPTDPRARAAQRVQRRLGKDAEKLSAAEARARAREEARRRRAQAKEQRSGVVAEEAVVRPPEEATERNLDEDVSVVEPLADETIAAEPAVEEPAFDDAIDDEVDDEEAELPKPVIGQRIDEPAPVDVDELEPTVDDEPEPTVDDEPEPTAALKPIVETREIHRLPEDSEERPKSRSSMAPIAGIVGLVALGISVLLAVGALLVALGFDSGGLYEALRAVANLLVGPLEGAFDFSGANAERKEHFLAWGAGSIGYLLISFVGQAVQRANDEE